ncbi:hypothetical protein [Streptomyces sp. NRRL F-2664]|uniref:hypothetical protein n=1 Tax=Streptomyces sp. NRRL F-2664 TaxID=1463842 RepID=UPI00131B800B
MTAVVGQLALTVTVDAWMAGHPGTAWWGPGFLVLSFLALLAPRPLDPKDR